MPPFASLLGFWPAGFPAEGVSGLFLAPGGGFTPLCLAYATQTLLPSISQSSMVSFAALQFSSVSKSTKPNLREGRQNKKNCRKNIPGWLHFFKESSYWPFGNSWFFSYNSCSHCPVKSVYKSLCSGLFSQAHHNQRFRQNWGGKYIYTVSSLVASQQ